MQHFVCTGGFDGESSVPGVCQAEVWEKEVEQLTPCACEEGLHEEAENASEGKGDEA